MIEPNLHRWVTPPDMIVELRRLDPIVDSHAVRPRSLAVWARGIEDATALALVADYEGRVIRRRDIRPRRARSKAPIPMPPPLSMVEVRIAVDCFPESYKLASKGAFPEPWKVHHEAAVQFTTTRLIESRAVATKEVNGGRAPGLTVVPATLAPPLPRPKAVESVTNRFLVDGSARTRRCGSCKGGQVRCKSGRAVGETHCPTSVTCVRCAGTGQVDQGAGDPGRCGECGGDGEQRCSRCEGRGRRTCETCDSRKSLACQERDASGHSTSYDNLFVSRNPDNETFSSGDVPRGVKPIEWQCHTRIDYKQPPGIPDLTAAAPSQMLQFKDVELLRSLDVAVLPLTRLPYGTGEQASAVFVIGTDSRVLGPGLKARVLGGLARRWLVPDLVVAALIVLGLLLLSETSGADSGSFAYITSGAVVLSHSAEAFDTEFVPNSRRPSGSPGQKQLHMDLLEELLATTQRLLRDPNSNP